MSVKIETSISEEQRCDNSNEISSSHCSSSYVKEEKDEFFIKEEKDFIIKEEKDELSLSDISATDLQKWNEFVGGGEPVSSTTSHVKVEKSIIKTIEKDPFGLYTLLLWYNEDTISSSEDNDRRIYLNKKCIENSFDPIGKCFVTCFAETIGDNTRIVGCVSFENESSALSAINDSYLSAKYNLELLILPSDNDIRLEGEKENKIEQRAEAYRATDSYYDNLGSEGSSNMNSSFERPEFFTGLRRTILGQPNQFIKPYVSCINSSNNHLPTHDGNFHGYWNQNAVSIQKIPSLLDISFEPTPNMYRSPSYDSYNCGPNVDLDWSCNEFIRNIRRFKDNQIYDARPNNSYDRESKNYRYIKEPLEDKSNYAWKRKRPYKDLDAVEEDPYPIYPNSKCIKEEKFTEKQTKWDELFALVKSLIVPNDNQHESDHRNLVIRPITGEKCVGPSDNEFQYHHLLLKHIQSSRPTSSRGTRITRSKEEAMKCIIDYKTQSEAGTLKFENIAEKYSDSSSVKSCDFIRYGPEKIVKIFAETVSKLQIHQISDPIVTADGIHLLKRIT